MKDDIMIGDIADKPSLHRIIADSMKDFMKENPGTYVNPNFMSQVRDLIVGYQEHFEDDELDELIQDMFGM